MLDPRTIEILLAEAIALQDWETVAVCERALTGMISVATMKRLSPEACVVVQTFELRLAGVKAANVMVPKKYTEIAELSQDKAIARLEEKIGQHIDLEGSDPVELCVEFEFDIDVADLGHLTDPAIIHDRPPTPSPPDVLFDCTILDDQDDDKTVVPS